MSGRNWVRLDHDAEDRGFTHDFERCVWSNGVTDEIVYKFWKHATADREWLQWLLHGAGHQHWNAAMRTAYHRKKRGWR